MKNEDIYHEEEREKQYESQQTRKAETALSRLDIVRSHSGSS